MHRPYYTISMAQYCNQVTDLRHHRARVIFAVMISFSCHAHVVTVPFDLSKCALYFFHLSVCGKCISRIFTPHTVTSKFNLQPTDWAICSAIEHNRPSTCRNTNVYHRPRNNKELQEKQRPWWEVVFYHWWYSGSSKGHLGLDFP